MAHNYMKTRSQTVGLSYGLSSICCLLLAIAKCMSVIYCSHHLWSTLTTSMPTPFLSLLSSFRRLMHSFHYLHIYNLLIVSFLLTFCFPSILTYILFSVLPDLQPLHSLLTLHSTFQSFATLYVPFSLCTSPCLFLSAIPTSGLNLPIYNLL